MGNLAMNMIGVDLSIVNYTIKNYPISGIPTDWVVHLSLSISEVQ
jgi:hypothetical protein